MRRPYAPRRPALVDLTSSEAEVFETLGRRLTVRSEDTIFKEDEPASSIYRIIAGRVNLATVSPEGRELIVRVLYTGDLLGLSAAIGKTKYEVSAVASSASTLQEISTQTFLQYLQSSKAATSCIVKALSEEYLDIVEHTKLLQLSGAILAKVARIILECAPCADITHPFPLSFTHDEMSRMAGCSRESVTRTLNIFRRKQYLEIHGHSMKILDPKQMMEIAGIDTAAPKIAF